MSPPSTSPWVTPRGWARAQGRPRFGAALAGWLLLSALLGAAAQGGRTAALGSRRGTWRRGAGLAPPQVPHPASSHAPVAQGSSHAPGSQGAGVRCPGGGALLAARYIESIQKSVSGMHLHTPSFEPGMGPMDKLRIEPYVEHSYAMTGLIRLKNVQTVLEEVFAAGVAGDFMECGVWRGGASIVARATMVAHGQTHRRVILADSFKGLPTARSGEDVDNWSKMDALAVSKDQVRSHFERMDLLDEKVEFVEGYFSDSLPPFRAARSRGAPIAVLRADGDMYESCMDILVNLYSFVPIGGYVIIDDWEGFPCKKAVEQFRDHVGADEPIIPIPVSGVYWRKAKDVHYSPRRVYRATMNEERGAASRR